MAIKLYNLARMLTTTTGTGTMTLDSAVLGHLSFDDAGVSNGDTISYGITDGANSEVGRGVYDSSAKTLSRSVLKSTNSDAAIDLSGAAQVIITALAEDFTIGKRNYIINPCGANLQAGVGSTADGAYTGIDQWVALTQSNAVTSSQLTDVEDGMPTAMRLSQANASAQRMGWLQPLESSFVKNLRSKKVTLAARVRMSASTILRYAIIEWTGTADTITKDVVNSWTNGTFTAGQFFVSSNVTIAGTGSTSLTANTLTDASLTASISSSMNNLMVFFWTDSAQAQNVTLDLGNVFLGQGESAPVTFDPPSPADDLRACQRYFQIYRSTATGARFATGLNSSTTLGVAPFYLHAEMRVFPTLTTSTPSTTWTVVSGSGPSTIALAGLTINGAGTVIALNYEVSSGLTIGNCSSLRAVNNTAFLSFDARL